MVRKGIRFYRNFDISIVYPFKPVAISRKFRKSVF